MKVSIIIPTRNRIKELRDCIKSLERQTIKPDEIIILGDADDEATERLVTNLKANYLNIIYLKCIGGTCKKRNLGINHVKGDVIIFLDDDIILHRDYIKNTKEIFKDKQVNIITGYIFDAIDLTNPLFMRKSDIEYILRNPNDELVKLIKEKIFQNSPVKYCVRYSLIRSFRSFIKSLFLLESPIKGRILPSGYRSEMPTLKKIKKKRKVEWVFGGNFAARKEVLSEFKFNEDLERYPYALNEDLEFSARTGRKYDIFISPKMLLLHLRSPGRKIVGRERLSCMVITTYLIAKLRGNMVAHRWSIFGLILGSIVKLPFDKSAKEEIKGVISGVKKLRGK